MTRRQELMRAAQIETGNLIAARASLAAAQRWFDLTGTDIDSVVSATAIERGVYDRWMRASVALASCRA